MIIQSIDDIFKAGLDYFQQAMVTGLISLVIYCINVLLYVVIKRVDQYRMKFSTVVYYGFVFVLLCIYLSYLIALTLSGREMRSRTGWVKARLFETFFLNGSIRLEAAENVLLFIPLGVLISLNWKNMRRWWKLLMVGFLTSAFIEITQLVTGRGFFQLDDILLNTIGTMIGSGIFFFLIKIVKRKQG